MSRSGVRNQTRLRLYENLATGILEGTHKVGEAANLLVDVRFSEIPQAFANAIEEFVTHRGVRCDVRCDVRERFAHLLEYTTFLAFGTTERDAIPSWFLQNYECFLAACLHMLLTKYDYMVKFRCFGFQERVPEPEREAARLAEARCAFRIAFDLCAGAKNYLSLDCLEASKGAHAVLVVCNHSRYQFLRCTRPSAVFRAFMDELAARILGETEECDVVNTQLAFGYFASTRAWQDFAQLCMVGPERMPHLERLQDTVRCARKRLRPCSPEVVERPSTPTDRPTSAEDACTPPQKVKRRAVAASLGGASEPFLDLVERIGVIEP